MGHHQLSRDGETESPGGISPLSLGEFEDAYSELWAWLTDALRQLGEAEPITGDPDMVAAQLARHKVEREIYT